ncbi:hypothetical protein [Parasitella parasitica]|uniref:Uncharacterized protein n=1 Tax=Parasitella parasitica TaxID=35722 RepID=A0A0B7NTL0_9FUNG|nr:hypothetical protein [Parasitella parasitica]
MHFRVSDKPIAVSISSAHAASAVGCCLSPFDSSSEIEFVRPADGANPAMKECSGNLAATSVAASALGDAPASLDASPTLGASLSPAEAGKNGFGDGSVSAG